VFQFLRHGSAMLLSLLFAVLLSACATQRPAGRACDFAKIAYPVGVGVDALDATAQSNFQRLLVRSLQQRDAGAPTRQQPWQWLVLSGGGQWGAFGAGFLKGWSDSGDRPEFDVVTGVSTGALIAPYAFLGKSYDDALLQSYRIASERDLVKSRSWFSLARANSFYDTTALATRVLAEVKQQNMIPQLQKEQQNGRRLFIGVVNADDGIFYAIDLTGLAAQSTLPQEVRERCMADYMLASGGVPIAFSPTFIDGNMLMDGSARTGLFVADLSAVVSSYGARTVNIYVIKNGALKLRQDMVKNDLAAIATRSVEIILDQLGDSGLRDIVEKPRLGSQTRFITADGVKCNGNDPEVLANLFVPKFMNCLMEEGRRIGAQGEARWFKSLNSATK
jgi:Patatin-like phospholipase